MKEEFDDNVFLQDMTGLANHESFVTTAIPALGLKYSESPSLTLQANYAPEISFFHAEPTEDFVLHRANLGLTGKSGGTEWDWQNCLIAIDGGDEGLVFSGPGGAPAAGGPRVRDRRDAAIFRGNVRVTQAVGKLLLRPVLSTYIHDFQTRHFNTPGYLNFVDRRDVNGGVDVGAQLIPGLRGFVGHRYGQQDEAQLLQFPEEYDNSYHRLLFSLEGKPRPWITVAASLGPEFRTFGDKIPASFGHSDELNLFIDASLTITPGKADTLVLAVREFEQPGFGGRSIYEDLTYDLTWQHRFGTHLAIAISGRAYNTDFTYPAMRDDWVLGASVTVAWTFNPQLQSEISYQHEDGESRIPNTDARDYSRNVVALGIRYKFR